MTAHTAVDDLIGQPLDAITTPCAVIDAEALEHNLKLLADYFAARRCKLRPHFKSHKCVTLARKQLEAGGCVGITCAKLSEAEVLVAGGVSDVLIANQVVGMAKVRRLAELNRKATVRAAVDSAENVAELSGAARAAGVTIGLLVEVDVGMKRCGVPPGKPALDLARAVAESKGLRFDGLQGYEGHLVMTPDPEERRTRVTEALKPLVETRRLIAASGIAVKIVSSGGTGTYDVTGNIDGIDEVQAGSYALMDANYRKLRPEFRNAAFVLAAVISVTGSRAVTDVGTKGQGCEFGPPVIDGRPESKVRGVAEEHTIIDNCPAKVGERLRQIPSHMCTTSNLYRWFRVMRGGLIEATWPIEGSGCVE